MGTRNLTVVVYKRQVRVAKYGQWDGYLSSAGVGMFDYLTTVFNREALAKAVENIAHLTESEGNKRFAALKEPADKAPNPFEGTYHHLSRDCAGYVLLPAIQDGRVTETFLNIEFVNDSLFCEWCYVVDLDKGTFEIYKGYNKEPLSRRERFYRSQPNKDGYYPVKLFKSYRLNRMPSKASFMKLVRSTEKR
jgi:hypothetical protein